MCSSDLQLDHKAGILPKVRGGHAIVRVDLETKSLCDALRRKNLRERGIEGARAYGRVEKMHFLGGRQKVNSVSQYVLGKRRWRRKLTKAVPLGLCLLAIQFGLKGETLLFANVD